MCCTLYDVLVCIHNVFLLCIFLKGKVFLFNETSNEQTDVKQGVLTKIIICINNYSDTKINIILHVVNMLIGKRKCVLFHINGNKEISHAKFFCRIPIIMSMHHKDM